MEGESRGIAIVGVGCRFPGANNIDEFWQILVKGENHVTEIPSERWNLEAYYDEDADAPGKMYPRKAGFLSNFDEFDYKLFEINEKEAQRMDPQQKYILECVFMALQDGGFTKKSIQRSKTGVFVGVMNDDYSRLTSRNDTNHYSVTGGSTSIMSARISYTFDLRGPCLSLNTACSSSLVAVHLGCQSLKSGECNMAICGGVNSLLTPSIFIQLSKARMVSRTGQCQAFSANADGYARGEGCGIVLLKKLSDALRDGDNIWATIVTGTNQDGRAASPMTAPSGEQQYQLLKTVYEEAGIDAKQIDYIEAHGTGTVAGDPVEVNSLGRFFLEKADKKIRYIGSVKTNIGHLESASGIAGIIKVLLMMKNNKIVESLLTGEQNPRIDFHKFHFEIPTKLTNWDKENKVACVNSFAFGGTNCHAVISTHREITENKGETNSKVPLLFCFSGQDENALQDSIQEFIKFCETHTETDIKSISYTSTVRRDHFQTRRSVTASSLDELVGKLKSVHTAEGFRPRKKLIFVFGGMGIAWQGMCKELMTEFQVFKEKIQEIDKYLKTYVAWSLYDKLLENFDVTDPMFGPISIFACQVALAALWKHLGIKPDSVLGQSIGEVAASHTAGIWSLEEAVKIIFYRTSVLANIGTGKMLLIRNYLASNVEKILPKYDDRANIALFYSPKSCVISGDTDVVEKIERDILSSPDIQDRISSHTLRLNTAFHSHHTEDSKNKILEALSGMHGCKPITEIISTVSGEKANENDFSTPDYWGKNIRNPVLFGKAVVNATQKEKFNIFVEIGPKPVLGNNIADLFTDENVVSVPSMKRNAELFCFMESIGKLHEHGFSLNWQNLYDKQQKNSASPKYTFSRNKCLHISDEKTQELMGMEPNNNLHPFLKTIDCSHEHKIIVSPKSIPSVYEHRFSGRILIPGALYAEAGFAIARHHFKETETTSVSVKFKHPVIIQSGRTEELDVYKSVSEEAITFVVEKKGNKFVEGTIEKRGLYPDITVDIQNVKRRCTERLTKQDIYENLQDIGMTFGNVLQLLEVSDRNDTEVLSNLILNSDIKQEMKETTIHPAVLDAMLQTISAFHQKDAEKQKSLPVQIEGLRIRKRVEDRMLVYTKIIKQTNIFKQFHIKLLSADGSVLAEIGRFITKALGSQGQELLYEMEWIPSAIIKTADVQTNSKRKWVIVTDQNQKTKLSDNFYSEYLDTGNVESDFLNTLQTKSAYLDSASAIIFLCPLQTSDDLTSGSFLQLITKHTMKLKQLMLHMSNMENTNIPLFIVTENAMSVTKRNTDLNIAATSFWGLFRTVIREKIYDKAVILDIHANEESSFQILMDAAVNNILTQDITKCPNEFVIEENTIWSQQIAPNEDMPLYRSNQTDKLCKANLCVENEDILKAYLRFDDQERQSSHAGDTTVYVTKVVQHSSSLFPLFLPRDDSSTYTSDVITLEASGEISAVNDAKTEVAFLYPCTVSTFTKVPEKCVIHTKHIPSYTPGILIKLMVLWQHYLSIREISHSSLEKEIFILSSDDTRQVADALLLMLETDESCFNIEIADINEEIRMKEKRERIVVSTVELNKQIIGQTQKLWQSAKHVICLDNMCPRYSTIELHKHNLDMQINIIRTGNVFTHSSTIENMPTLKTWINNNRNAALKISEILQNVTEQSRKTCFGQMMEISVLHLSNDNRLMTVRVSEESLLRSDGIYIVVGGLTGLGWESVRFLAQRGAGTIVTINRRMVQREKAVEIEKLEETHNCQIITPQADVTNITSLKKALSEVDNKCPSKLLKGVIFGAAVLDDKMFINMSQETFLKVASPKIQGAWNMHLLTQNKPLDFFIMHSSITAVLGNPGQSNYGAANAFQDSLAHKRRLSGLAGQSINWGPLNLGLLQDKPSVVEALRNQGYIPLSIDEIHKCLLAALMLDKPAVVAAKFSTIQLSNSIMKEKNTALEFKLRPIIEIPTSEMTQNTTIKSKLTFDLEHIKASDLETRRQLIQEYIIELLADVLSCDKSLIELDKGVENLGVDSMQAMTFSNQIYQTFEIRITPNGLLQQNLSANEITDMINSKLLMANKTEIPNISLPVTKETLSYMEHTFYKMYCRNPADPSLYYVNEILLPASVADPKLWEKITNQLISRHEVLKTTFVKVPATEDIRWNVKRKIFDDGMKLDFRILKAYDSDAIEKNTREAFHLETQGPVRFIFIQGEKCHLRTVYNSICFDMQGVASILKDMVDIFLFNKHNMPLSDLKTVGGSLIVIEMEKVLHERGFELKEFWKHFLEEDIPTIIIGKTSQSPEAKSGVYESHKETVRPELCDALRNLSKTKGLTIYRLITSIYQLLLHLITKQATVAISTTVDIKQYVPNAAHAVGLGTNYVPLVAKFPSDKVSIEEFLKVNKTALQNSVDHCVCPTDIIGELVGPEKLKNIVRNKIVIVEDEFVAPLLQKAEDAGYGFELTQSGDLGTHTETQLSLWNRTKSKQMSLELIYNSNNMSSDYAQNMISLMLEIADKITTDSSATIADLKQIKSVKNLIYFSEKDTKGSKT